MRRFAILVSLAVICSVPLIFARPARAWLELTRVYTASMTYPADNYKGRLINAKAAFVQLQTFFDGTAMQPGTPYSFIHAVLHDTISPDAGYVMTEKGYGYGACGASSLLHNLVSNALFRDEDGIEKPLFEALSIWTWTGDPTYGPYGATIRVDPTGKHVKDYVWRLNPAYSGAAPTIKITFDEATNTASMTVSYADESAPPVYDSTPNGKSAQLADQFKAIIGYRKLALAVLPISPVHGVNETGYNMDEQYPVASAFKGPVAIYFFENVSPDVWRSVPIHYWSVDKAEAVPAEYRAAWTQHHDLFKNLYMMAILSENDATGKVLTYVYKNTAQQNNGDNPVRAFNNWSRDKVGINPPSGLRSWLVGGTICPRCADDRYEAQMMIYARRIFYLNNTFTPRDLARYYVYLATQGRALGYYDAAVELLSNQKFSMIRTNATPWGITVASKDGYIAPNSDNGTGYRISTDAGLITLPDGEQYAVAFLAFDSGDLLAPSIRAMSQTLVTSQRAAF